MVCAAVMSLIVLAAPNAHAQMLRGPDLGLWFRQQRDASGGNALVVDRLLDDGPFAVAGLREADGIVSVDGRPIQSEPQFVRAIMSPPNGDHVINVVVARSGQEKTLSLKARDVWQGVVAADQFYQAGFLVDERHRDAVIVLRVFPLTPAFYAGLRQADTIISASGQTVSSPIELAKFLHIGGKMALGVTRNGQPRQMTISLPTRRTLAATSYPPGGSTPPPASFIPNLSTTPPLLAPPQIPSTQPPIPSPPPPIPQLPPPGAVLNR